MCYNGINKRKTNNLEERYLEVTYKIRQSLFEELIDSAFCIQPWIFLLA